MSKQIRDAYIRRRDPHAFGKAPRGMLRHVRPDDMLAHVIKRVLEQVPAIEPKQVADVVVGCAFPEAEQGLNLARIGALLAGLPDGVPGITMNRYCSSGLNAVQIAADRIRVGEADVVIAGGAESMSLVPMMGNKVALNPEIFAKDENYAIAYRMGITAEKVARQWKVSREDQDAFALQSHRRALAAAASGAFRSEISPIEVTRRAPDFASGEVRLPKQTLAEDEGPRADTSLEALAKLKTVFDAKGTVTAGNSSQTSDGAGAGLLVSEEILRRYELTPLARYVTFAVKGVPPAIMGIWPKAAVPAALERSGIGRDELKWIELNEAFAAQALAVIRDLGLDPTRVNPHGGRSRSVIPSGPPARSVPRAWCTACGARASMPTA